MKTFYRLARNDFRHHMTRIVHEKLDMDALWTEPIVGQKESVRHSMESCWRSTLMNMLWPGVVQELERVIVENFSPRARAIPPHLRRSLEKQLLASAILADSYVKDPKVLFVTRWQPLLKRFAGDHSYQLLYTPFQILLRCFTAIVVATVRGFMQGFLLVGAHSLHVMFLALVMPYKNRLRNMKQLAVACLHTFVILVASIGREVVASAEINHAATEFTLVLVLFLTGAVELISPVLGCMRAWIGMVCLAVQSTPDKYFVGATRTRSALFLHPRALRTHKTPGQRLREYASMLERQKTLRANVNEGWVYAGRDGMSFQDMIDAIQKWMTEHVVPCIIACCCARAEEFCAEHMKSEEALRDIQISETVNGFLALSKERFAAVMLETALRVLPDKDEAVHLLENHIRAAEMARKRSEQRAKRRKKKGAQALETRGLPEVVDGVRSARQATPVPPWVDARAKKHARKRVLRKAWQVTEFLWEKAQRALKGQILTQLPGAMLDVEGVVKEERWQFEISEAELLAREDDERMKKQDKNELENDQNDEGDKLLQKVKQRLDKVKDKVKGLKQSVSFSRRKSPAQRQRKRKDLNGGANGEIGRAHV